MNDAAKPKVLALVPATTQTWISHLLTPIVGQMDFCSDASEIVRMPNTYACFDVLILPVTLLNEELWLTWQDLWLTHPRPAILAYTQHADFRMWSSALELGCYDLILEPFEEQALCNAVLCAYASTKAFDA